MSDEAESNPTTGSLLTRLPGRARPRVEVQREFDEAVANMRKMYPEPLWFFFVPKAEEMYRWRIQLECGCIDEGLTAGKDKYPDEGGTRDPITRCRLPVGERWCGTDHGTAKPYREIVEWVEKEIKEFPPDPEEPQHGLDPEVWAKIRHAEPHSSAFWRVKLSCGHFHQHAVTDVDWNPDDGPKTVSKKRAAEMKRDFKELFDAEQPGDRAADDPWPDHIRRMLDLRWPRPEPEEDCYACAHAWRITGYQRIGWLVPRKKPPPPPPTERELVEPQLAKAEADVERLRRKLNEST